MQMAFKDGMLYLRYLDDTQFAIVRGWNLMRWNKQRQMFCGPATGELLNKLASISALTPPVAAERDRLNRIREAVDRERMNEDPVPLYRYPVKASLFKHQIRGANMALLTFGLVEPPEEQKEQEQQSAGNRRRGA